MVDDNIKRFPQKFLGVQAKYSTLESELDPQNPSTDSLLGLLIERRRLINKYTSSDGSVREVETEISERLDDLAGRPTAPSPTDGAEPATGKGQDHQ